jgi:hypothetical protein
VKDDRGGGGTDPEEDEKWFSNPILAEKLIL